MTVSKLDYAKAKVSLYFWNFLVAIDQLVNTLLGGDPDETLSSRMGKNIKEGKCKFCKVICYLLNKIDANHCEKSVESDEGSRQVTGD